MEAGQDDAADRLTYEIFSILESKFLFGYGGGGGGETKSLQCAPPVSRGNRVCVLSVDGGARPEDGLLAAAALVRLEAAVQRRAGSKAARLADFFDVAAGSGAGGVLAAMLFARGPCGRPMYSADDALGFLLRRVRRRGWSSRAGGLLRRPAGAFHKVFGELTLRDTVRPVLVPCYDLATRAPFLFSRADAAQSPAYDFRLRDACAATCAPSDGAAAVEASSVDGVTRITAVGSGVALGNPTAAAITHVLNNRREFPAAAGVDNLLVISIGTGEAAGSSSRHRARTPVIARIAAEGASDMVDQAVAMAFGQHRTSNYVRIQGMGVARRRGGGVACGGETAEKAVWVAEAMLQQRNVEAVMFQGRRLAGETNAEKVERFARELIKEHGRRKQHVPPAASGGGGGSGLDCHVSKKQP
ncbi:patatin-like protein 3 [Oryza glaberrima]|uniref:patatin-like protein 3 n=1 Tax=Oryza glaberrima TaxID=4538 RepID=UPI00224C2C12|nr:patatin-like protein 3 [Oryza glaberrima]